MQVTATLSFGSVNCMYKQEQAGETTGAGQYTLGSCCTYTLPYLDCELSQDRTPDPPDFFWLNVHVLKYLN